MSNNEIFNNVTKEWESFNEDDRLLKAAIFRIGNVHMVTYDCGGSTYYSNNAICHYDAFTGEWTVERNNHEPVDLSDIDKIFIC